MTENAIIFIDASNFNQVLRRTYKNQYDVGKLIELIKKLTNTNIIKTHYYISKFQNNLNDIRKQNKFFNALKRNIPNFELHLFELQKTKDGYHEKKLDTEMSLDMLQYSSQCDTIILLTEDSDFVPIVQRLKSANKNVILVLPDCANGHQLREESSHSIILNNENIESIYR